MIERLERTSERLTIETRRGWSRKQQFGFLLLPVLVWIALAIESLLLAHFDPASGRGASTMQTIIIALGPAVVGLAVLLQMFAERERLVADGAHVVYERFVGLWRVAHESYDLLSMRGLRSPAATHVVLPDGTALTPPSRSDWIALDSSTRPPSPAPPSVMPGLVFHYKDDVVWVGRTLALSEYGQVAQALLDHEEAVRGSFGMHDGHGLRDQSVWAGPAATQLAGMPDWSRRSGRVI